MLVMVDQTKRRMISFMIFKVIYPHLPLLPKQVMACKYLAKISLSTEREPKAIKMLADHKVQEVDSEPKSIMGKCWGHNFKTLMRMTISKTTQTSRRCKRKVALSIMCQELSKYHTRSTWRPHSKSSTSTSATVTLTLRRELSRMFKP